MNYHLFILSALISSSLTAMDHSDTQSSVISYSPKCLYSSILLQNNAYITQPSARVEPKILNTPDGTLWRYNKEERIYEPVFLEEIQTVTKRGDAKRVAYLAVNQTHEVTVFDQIFMYKDGAVVKKDLK